MATQVTMPVLGLTMEEGTVAEWLKQEGDTVKKDEPLLTVEMDKGTMEVPSPAAGVLRRIVVGPGVTVPVRTLIAEIGEPGETLSVAGSVAGGPGDPPPLTAAPVGSSVDPARRLFASPRARMRARVMNVDLAAIRGSGPHGRIVEADVLTATPAADSLAAAATADSLAAAATAESLAAAATADSLAAAATADSLAAAATADSLAAAGAVDDVRTLATPLARRLAHEHGVSIDAIHGTGPGGRITQDDVLRAAEQSRATPAAGIQPLSRLRRLTAERMAASAQATARVTLFLEADFVEASHFRQQLQPEFARLSVPRLPWDALIARAAALALGEHPAMRVAWVDGEGLRQGADAVHVGVAVALEPEGLVVPVLRDASNRSLRELSADLLQLADRARAGRLSPAEMQDGVFTITNLGAYRVDGFTPIINPPETAILGVGRIVDKPVVVDGRIEARTMCTLSLSFDHRVVDGATAAAFLARLAELLERPYALLGI